MGTPCRCWSAECPGPGIRCRSSPTPVDAAVGDRRAAGHRSAAGEAPKDGPWPGVERAHVLAVDDQRPRVDHAADGAIELRSQPVTRAGGMPNDLPAEGIEDVPIIRW